MIDALDLLRLSTTDWLGSWFESYGPFVRLIYCIYFGWARFGSNKEHLVDMEVLNDNRRLSLPYLQLICALRSYDPWTLVGSFGLFMRLIVHFLLIMNMSNENLRFT